MAFFFYSFALDMNFLFFILLERVGYVLSNYVIRDWLFGVLFLFVVEFAKFFPVNIYIESTILTTLHATFLQLLPSRKEENGTRGYFLI